MEFKCAHCGSNIGRTGMKCKCWSKKDMIESVRLVHGLVGRVSRLEQKVREMGLNLSEQKITTIKSKMRSNLDTVDSLSEDEVEKIILSIAE